MSEYFGNGVTATLDGDALGQVKTMSIPEKSSTPKTSQG